MKKLTALFLLMITIWCLAAPPMSQPASARPIHSIQTTSKKLTDKIVYIAKATKTYHRSSCRHHAFTIPEKLKEAQKKNYTPCKVCNP